MENFKGKKVVWAIDPYELDTRPGQAAQEALRQWATRLQLAILPVHIINFSDSDLSLEERGTSLKSTIPIVKRVVSDYLSDLCLFSGLFPTLPQVREPKIIVEHSLPVHKLVE